MENKKILALLISLLIIYASAELPFIAHAQQPTTSADDLPSDLSLDLGLAKQNPAPEQKAIVASETQQATVVAITGEASTVVPQDVISTQAKTEPQLNAVNPDQTTSEQVITRPVTVQVDQNTTPAPENQPSPTSGNVNSPSPTSQNNNVNGPDINNLVPGTSVVAPDDNSAPSDNSGNPNLPAPTPTVDNGSLNTSPSNQVSPSSAPDNSGSTSQPTAPSSAPDNSGSTSQPTAPGGSSSNQPAQQSVPPESQPTAPGGSSSNQPAQQSVPPESQPAANPPSDQSSPPAPADSGSGSTDTTAPPPSEDSVQGASTGPEPNIFQRVITNIGNFLTGK